MTVSDTQPNLTLSSAFDGSSLWHLLPLGICVIDADLVVLGWNRQLESWTGLEAVAVEGRRLTEIFPGFAIDRFQTRILQVFESGVPAVLSTALHQQFLPIASLAYPQEPAMIQETRLLRLSTLPPRVVVTIADMTHSVRQQRLLRRDRGQLLKTQQALEEVNASLQESLAQTAANNDRLEAEIRERQKVEVELRRQTTELIAAKAREATNRQHLEKFVRDLTVARQQAETADRTKSEFLANMSHEIRTPMTAILGYIDILQDVNTPEELRTGAKESIHRNGEHLMEIINDILDISKIEAGQMTVERIPVCIRDVAEGVIRMMRPRAEQRGLTLELRTSERLPTNWSSDPTRLRQILVNLVGNAIKFTKSGSVIVDVVWREPQTSRGRLVISVADTGIGMSPEAIQGLFQPFTQADTRMTRMYGGTGLGLAISQRLAKMLGGEIRVNSTVSVGSTFTLELECAGEPTHADVTTSDCPKATGSVSTEENLEGIRVLVVDDAPDNRKLLSFHLKKAGAELDVAENGQEALDKITAATARPFDVILMDMQMPVLDGYAATTQLRLMGNLTPVIAVTAHVMSGDREKCLKSGCSDYLTKPIQREDLLKTTLRWVQKSLAIAGQ